MFNFIKILFRSSLVGLAGFLLSLLFVITVRLINYNIITQSQNKSLDFISSILFVITNKLTNVDFTLAFFGFLLTTFITLLWMLEKGKRYF